MADRVGYFQTFDRAHHGNCGSDNSIPIEQGSSKNPYGKQNGAFAGLVLITFMGNGQGQEGQNSSFAAIVRAHNESEVFNTDNRDQRPEYQGKNAKYVFGAGRDGMCSMEAFAQSVERTGPDISINHAEGAETEA